MAYTKQNFEDGQVLKAEHLNKMEQGIVEAGVQPDFLQNDETAADFIKNRTHYEGMVNVGDTLTFDGNGTGLTSAGGVLFKVSDQVPTMDDLANGVYMSGYLFGSVMALEQVPNEMIVDMAGEGVEMISIGESVFIAKEDNVSVEGLVVPEKGIYFPWIEGTAKVTALMVNGYSFEALAVKTLDRKYLPGCARVYLGEDQYIYSKPVLDANYRVTEPELRGWVESGLAIYICQLIGTAMVYGYVYQTTFTGGCGYIYVLKTNGSAIEYRTAEYTPTT